MSNITTNMHYVPKCYLKRFAIKERVSVFDKVTLNSYSSNIDRVTSRRFLYLLTPECFPEDYEGEIDPMLLENLFGEIETHFTDTTEQFLAVLEDQLNDKSIVEKKLISEEFKLPICKFIVSQYFRTIKVNSNIQDSYRHAIQDLASRSPGLTIVAEDKEIPELQAICMQANYIFDPEYYSPISHTLMGRRWSIGITTDARHLITSDHPVALHHLVPGRTGIRDPGVELFLPLTPRIVLVLADGRFTQCLSPPGCDDRVFFLAENDVERLNLLQARDSRQYLISQRGGFERERALCEENPDWCDLLRYPRLSI